jgi:cyclohexanone monooxygenase
LASDTDHADNDNGDPGIDFDALSRRYAEERDKRLRADAIGQYQAMEGKFSVYARDPHADPDFARDPVRRDCDVLVLGGGFGGLLAGVRLREKGVEDIVFVDKAGDFGGTWYWNRYPGIRCDIESYIYVPLLEETGFIPSEKYAKGAEIFEHCQRIGRQWDLYRGALFQTAVKELVWNDKRQRWIVATDRGDELAARFVVSCTGLLSNPKLPGIPGIETFAGKSFHTSRWDYGYTGGDADGNLTGLADKVVGIIGTGSTGIQCVPPVAEWAKHLYVFQRTPCSVDVRGNRPTDPVWAASLEPGWQDKRSWNFTYWTSGIRDGEDLVADSWTNLLGEPTAVTGGATEAADPEAMQRAEILKMEKVRRRIDEIVEDRATAEALKPYYNYFCKRPGFSDDYLQTFNRDNVTLVDTAGRGVERITPKGVVVAGKEYALDCLVFATGFDFMTRYTREAGLRIVGRGGLSLDEHWATGARTLYGITTNGFPNFFVMSLVQSGIAINYMPIALAQTDYIAHVIAGALMAGIGEVEPRQEAVEAWTGEILAGAGLRRAFLETCTPSYFNYEGKKDKAYESNEPYPGGAIKYLHLLAEQTSRGMPDNLETAPFAAEAAD